MPLPHPHSKGIRLRGISRSRFPPSFPLLAPDPGLFEKLCWKTMSFFVYLVLITHEIEENNRKLIVAMVQLIAEELIRSKKLPDSRFISEKYKIWAKFNIIFIAKKAYQKEQEPFGLFWLNLEASWISLGNLVGLFARNPRYDGPVEFDLRGR